nr:hypothetical protein [Spirochaetaceae bacterium]
SDSGEKGNLINWSKKDHPAFTVNKFSGGSSGYWESPRQWEAADFSIIDDYLIPIEKEEFEERIKDKVIEILYQYKK